MTRWPNVSTWALLLRTRALYREAVVCGDGADAGDLVGRDRHAQTGSADQQRPVGVAGGDEFGGPRSRRAGRRCARRRPTPTSTTDSTIGFSARSRFSASLYSKPASSAADHDPQFVVHFDLSPFRFVSRWSSTSASARLTALNARAIDTAPASGVPRLFSAADGRGRSWAAGRRSPARPLSATLRPSPAKAAARSCRRRRRGSARRWPAPARRRGSCRRPRPCRACWMLRSAAATPSLTMLGVGSVVVADRVAEQRAGRRPTAHRRCRPARSAQASAPAVSTAPAPAPRSCRRAAASTRGARAALHADAVVAVAGDRVDVAESLDVARRWCRGSR